MRRDLFGKPVSTFPDHALAAPTGAFVCIEFRHAFVPVWWAREIRLLDYQLTPASRFNRPVIFSNKKQHWRKV